MLVCHFDFTSPAAAVAVLRLQRIADQGGSVAFVGLDVLGIEAAIPATLDQLAELERVRDRAAALGLAMRRPSRRPPTLPAHLVADLAETKGLGSSWRHTVLAGYWERGLDVSDPEVLAELAGVAGLDGGQVGALVADRRARVALRQRMLQVRGRGVGGVPVLDVGGTLIAADLSDDDLRQLASA
jgi:predicted DsbA family dithiol-disulfide isomerase